MYAEGAFLRMGLPAAASSLCWWSIASIRNGTHPVPLSTETMLRSGCRSSTPPIVMFRMILQLLKNNTGLATVMLAARPIDSHGLLQNDATPDDEAPIWKFTGSSFSMHASQNGFQASCARSGVP